MPKRALIALAVLGLAATACVSASTPAVDYGQGQRFVPFVVDATDDVGQGSAIALTADGAPYISYFGFPAKLAEGEIAVPRPLGAPAVPGVLLATAGTNDLWQRGAVNTIDPPIKAAGINVAFGPVLTPNLGLTDVNSNGTAVALADDGTVYVTWVMGGGVYVANTKLGGTSTVDKVFDIGTKLDQAGPIGKPGITLDGSGAPWVAFTVDSSAGRQVHVVHNDGTKWVDEVAATAATCNGCDTPQATGIGVVGDAPLVVFTDASAGSVRAATLQGSTWSVTTVAHAASIGRGLSFATDGKGAFASYFGGDGSVQLASLADGTWTTTKVGDVATATASAAPAASGSPSATPAASASPAAQSSTSGNLAPTTAVAVDGAGTIYVAWQDTELHLSSGTDSFSPIDIGHTTASADGPALASSDAGVALAWYDTVGQNQMVGFYGDLQNLLVAQPSPSITLSAAPSPSGGATCGKDKKVSLDLVAKGTAFDTNCLVAAPGSFTITLDNQDAGIPHNVDVFDQKGGKSLGASTLSPGPAKESLDLKLAAGTYYFQCDAHPTTMFGDLVVVAGAK